ncbi:MAG: dienelactone hydrolase family protein [Candidatus Tectimicrobiota bacterium]
MTSLQWIGELVSEGGVTERRFNLERASGLVPGIIWTPAQHEQPLPLVLIGHGGSGHKRADRQLLLGRRLAGVSHLAVAAIDGPFHGDRVPAQLDRRQYQEKMAAAGVENVTDGMVDDWSATLDALTGLKTIDAHRVAYIGFSMGTRFGLPYVAAAGSRLRCAVLGKNGTRQASPMPTAVNMAQRFKQDAPTIMLPLLFHVQWDDELFPRDGQFELFDLFGTQDKQLIAFPGPHGAATPAAIDAWCGFVTQKLRE